MGTSIPPPGFGGSDPESHGSEPHAPGSTYGSLPRYQGGASDSGSPDPGVPGPLGVFETVAAAWGLYGADAVKLWQVVAMVIIPVQALVFVLRAISVPGGSVLHNAKIYVQPGTSDGGFVGISLLGVLLTVLALLISTGAANRILLGRHLHHPADLSTSFRFAVERWLPLLWVSILVGVFVAIGFVLIIIPGIYLFVSFVIAIPALMAEDQQGLNALRRSRQLVSGNWWHVLGCVIVGAIVAVVGEVVINLVADALVSGLTPHSVTGFLAINAIVSALISILVYPFTAAVFVVIYVDMLVRKRDPQLERLLA